MSRHSGLHVMAYTEFKNWLAGMPHHAVEHAMACEIEEIGSVEDATT